MNFRRKRIKGQNKRLRRTWLSDEGYRIVWRKEVYGVRVPARFQPTVRTILANGQMWDFVGRRLFKTMMAAQEACEKHQSLWTKAAGASAFGAPTRRGMASSCGLSRKRTGRRRRFSCPTSIKQRVLLSLQPLVA